MFFRKKPAPHTTSSELPDVIDSVLPDADPETRSIVTSIAGLSGCVSYADRDFSSNEQTKIAELLGTIHGVGPREAARIVHALKENIIHISTTEATRYSRTLKELADRELRVRVLDLLLDVAAADHELSNEEVIVLRQITKSLGLEQDDYNRLQVRHRNLLHSLQ